MKVFDRKTPGWIWPFSPLFNTTSAGFRRISLQQVSHHLSWRTLADNPTARDFVSLLPLKISMNDLFGREKYGDLPRAISETGPRTHSYHVGDIAYWSPDHQLAVYYRQDNQTPPSPGVIPIAKMDAGMEAFQVSGSVKVTIERAQ
jgi:Uncharacterized conserved protein